jgi:hypothetical protein
MREAGFGERAVELGGYDVSEAGAVRLVNWKRPFLSAVKVKVQELGVSRRSPPPRHQIA